MRRNILLISLLCGLGYMTANARRAGLNMVAEEEKLTDNENSCAVIWHKEGYRIWLALNERPRVKVVGDSLTIESERFVNTYPYESIAKMTYEIATPDIMQSIGSETKMTDRPFKKTGESLVFDAMDKELQVRIVNTGGALIKEFTVPAGKAEFFSLANLNRGIYLINTNKVTYKITVR